MARPDRDYKPSGLLPDDSFNRTFDALVGHPGGAHTQPTVLKVVDFYGNSVDYIVQTVKWEKGESVFLTVVDGARPAKRLVIPPTVLAVMLRQRDSVQLQVKRRHGKRLAEERKAAGITPFQKKARA